MKQISLIFLLAATLSLFAGEKYSVVINESSIEWEGFKPASSHVGSVNLSSGVIEVAKGKVTGGEFVIDLNSIKNFDLKDPSWNSKLVSHLKSEDFFYTEKYPYARFVIKNIKPIEGNKYEVTGDLSARGKTNEIKFSTEIVVDKNGINVKSDIIELDRTLWDLKYNSKKFSPDLLKDNIIKDIMHVKVLIKAKAK